MITKTFRRLGAGGLLAAILVFGQGALADGDAEAGKAKSTPCTACHGPDGNSVNPEWPSIAGQHAKYAAEQLAAFKAGKRKNVLMSAQALGLSEQDMEDLGAYYEAQDAKPAGEADPALVDLGERIYRGGNLASGISACIACHGPAGRGNPTSPFPNVSGQHATYLELTLKAYRSGERVSAMSGMMNDIAARMTDDEIKAVASYMQGLRPAQ